MIVGKTNKNDVIKIIGNPHSTSLANGDVWIYFERTIVKGKLIKLGKNILKENNILQLKFNRYGILSKKIILNKEQMNKVNYSKRETKNDITKKSFVGKFLSSIKQKMYGSRKK